jgi:hypothetical protein
MKRILTISCLAAVAVVSYRLGAESKSEPPMESAPLVMAATPVDATIANPTAVLLGEEKVPGELLTGPVKPAEGLIVPDLKLSR